MESIQKQNCDLSVGLQRVFEREYNLSKEPLRIDLLIIKKTRNVTVENEIGKIFRKYNVIEYKGPGDELTIDDYFKVLGYACIYKGLGTFVNQIPAEEITVSFVREAYPRNLFVILKKMGLAVEEAFPGVYRIKGNVLFPTQVVVTGRLEKEMHRALRVLSKKTKKEDAQEFIKNAMQLTEPGDRQNIDAILQASVSANYMLYEDIRRDFGMCEALRRLMKDEIEEELSRGREEGRAEGKAEGVISILLELGYCNGDIISALQKKLEITEEQADITGQWI